MFVGRAVKSVVITEKHIGYRAQSMSRNIAVLMIWLRAGWFILGQYRMLDPTTGQQVNVQATSNYFYRVKQDLGANTSIDVTRLLRIDVDTRQ